MPESLMSIFLGIVTALLVVVWFFYQRELKKNDESDKEISKNIKEVDRESEDKISKFNAEIKNKLDKIWDKLNAIIEFITRQDEKNKVFNEKLEEISKDNLVLWEKIEGIDDKHDKKYESLHNRISQIEHKHEVNHNEKLNVTQK